MSSNRRTARQQRIRPDGVQNQDFACRARTPRFQKAAALATRLCNVLCGVLTSNPSQMTVTMRQILIDAVIGLGTAGSVDFTPPQYEMAG